MRVSAYGIQKALLDAKPAARLADIQLNHLLKKPVLYRYARPSQKVKGVITAFTYDQNRVWVKWEDGRVEARNLKSLEIIK